jgi:hypothetical protein
MLSIQNVFLDKQRQKVLWANDEWTGEEGRAFSRRAEANRSMRETVINLYFSDDGLNLDDDNNGETISDA